MKKHGLIFLLVALGFVISKAVASGLPLIEATKKGDLQAVRTLIAKGADANAPDPAQNGDESLDAVHWAAKCGHAEVLAYLLDHRGALNARDSKFKETPLIEAAQFQHPDCVKLLLDRRADVHAKGLYGGDALYSIVNNIGFSEMPESAKEIIRMLIAHGASPNTTDKDGRSLLYMPAYGNAVKLVKFMLECKVDPKLAGKDGKTIMDAACEGAGDVEMFATLHKAGLKCSHDLNTCIENAERQKKTRLLALLTASQKPGDLNIADAPDEATALEMLERGADPNKPCQRCDYAQGKLTPLHRAAIGNQTHLMAALLKRKVNMEVEGTEVNGMSGTPLQMAARHGNAEAVELLLQAGANANARDKYAETALMKAAEGPIDYSPSDGPPPDWSKIPKYVKTIRLLVSAGAKISAKTDFGVTASDIILKNRNATFIEQAEAALQIDQHGGGIGGVSQVIRSKGTQNLKR